MSWPSSSAARDRFVLDRRPPRAGLDPWQAQGLLVEQEPDDDSRLSTVATVFLTGRECPFRCAMCDLWQHTITEDTPVGAIAAQVARACRELDARGVAASVIKLYNAGSFFDPRAVPEGDYDALAHSLQRFTRIVVESHPSLVGPRLDCLLAGLQQYANVPGKPPALEVAMGLETVHPDALERLHKRMDVPSFRRAAEYLRARSVGLRVFLLIAPPFVPASEEIEWLLRSIDVALASGASTISLVPTRGGNGTLEALEADGQFSQPTLEQIEERSAAALAHVAGRARLLVDLWDIGRFGTDPGGTRVGRLQTMNLTQTLAVTG